MVTKPFGFLFLRSGGLTAFQTAFPFSKAVEGPLLRRSTDAGLLQQQGSQQAVKLFAGSAPIATKKRDDLPHGHLLEDLSPEQPRPALIKQPAPFGTYKRPRIEKCLLFVVVDGEHAFSD